MINAVFRPIERWPGAKRVNRRNSPFDSSFMQTLDLLEMELNYLHAKNIVIQAEADLSQIRNDGWLKASAKVSGPAVILTFESKGSVYSYPCDTFTHWHANIRAIALSLEALRKVDRYGVTGNSEQYQGFRRVAAADAKDERRAALDALARIAMVDLSDAPDADEIESAYRIAARRCHPDTAGLSKSVEWTQLQWAVGILRPKKAGGMGSAWL